MSGRDEEEEKVLLATPPLKPTLKMPQIIGAIDVSAVPHDRGMDYRIWAGFPKLLAFRVGPTARVAVP